MRETNYEVLNIEGTKHAPIKMWTKGVPVEAEAKQQLINTASMPFVKPWVAVMPDVHLGMGATVGSVVPTVRAIIPAAVGVDIGCGMMAVKTSLHANDLPDNLHALRIKIEAAVPHGRSNGGRAGDVGAWDVRPNVVDHAWNTKLSDGYARIVDTHQAISGGNSINHLGTLGTGNHFIEICLDESSAVWVVLHSGSRGIGNRIGSYFIDKAKREMEKWYISLPDSNLAYFPEGSEYFSEYVRAVHWAQEFATINREIMMGAVLHVLACEFPFKAMVPSVEVVNCHHNYVAFENHFGKDVIITRKGAVRAGLDEMGIIPGSMGARTYIVRGLGNKESFESCSHGAGRVMSRTEAKRRFTVEDNEKATAGIECRKDEGVIDEIPMAYKDIDAVMEAQKDLVEIVHTLRQVVCVKG